MEGVVLWPGDESVRVDARLTFGVFDDLGVVALHDGDAGVGGAKIDSDDGGEGSLRLIKCLRVGLFGKGSQHVVLSVVNLKITNNERGSLINQINLI